MANSSLVDYTKISPNSTNPRNKSISKITIHHMAGNLTVEACGSIFASSSRQASANYGIGTDGRVGMYVEEANRSWCSSSASNDHMAVTIEVANDGDASTNWHVSDTAYNKLIDLCVDICERNGISKLNYTGDSSGNLTTHDMFKSTTCPGPYLKGKMSEIASEVNSRLNGTSSSSSSSTSTSSSTSSTATYTGDITYQSYDNVKKKWLPEVVNYNDYAGNLGNALGGLRAKPKNGEIKIQAHVLGGDWLDWVSSSNYSTGDTSSGSSYAGLYGKSIDAIRIKSTKGYVTYQAHVKGGSWLSEVDSRNADDGTTSSYAGVIGKAIDAIRMK